MFGGFEEQQKLLEKKLEEKKITASSPDQEVTITMNGNMIVENITVDISKVDLSNSEQVEDLLVVTFNEVLDEVKIAQAAESKKLLSSLMPGGMDNLESLFGG
jgi:DNA-binding protein YbaB